MSGSDTRRKPVHVFVGFTPLHAENVEKILPSLDGDIFCFFTKNWPDSRIIYKKIGFKIPSEGLLRKIAYILNAFIFSIKIRYIAKNEREFNVYVPHPRNIFSNFIFFSRFSSKVHIYEDGILNYYDAINTSNISLPELFFSYTCAMPYKHYSGHLSGCHSRRITTVYLSRPDFLVNRELYEKVMTLPGFSEEKDLNENVILFLDQDTSRHLSNLDREGVIAKMVEAFPRSIYKYYYKSHHDFSSNLNMEEINPRLGRCTAEEVAREIRPGVVISFFSSALINIKQETPNTRCIAISASTVKVKINGIEATLADIFLPAKVECIRKESYQESTNLLPQ